MSSEIQVAGLIKIGELGHIQMLQSSGLLFLNTLKYYREIESSESNLRKDHREGASTNENLKSMELLLEGKRLPLKILSGRINEYHPENLNHHIYCMYAIKSEYLDKGQFIENDLIKFGASALIISDHSEFLKRVQSKLDSLNIYWEMDMVKYYHPKIDSINLTTFHKPKEFEFQTEFRILVKGHPESTLQIEIGSIKDISVIVESKDLLKLTIESIKADI